MFQIDELSHDVFILFGFIYSGVHPAFLWVAAVRMFPAEQVSTGSLYSVEGKRYFEDTFLSPVLDLSFRRRTAPLKCSFCLLRLQRKPKE